MSALLTRQVQVEFVPNRLEISAEFRALARLERRWPLRAAARKRDLVLRLDAPWPPTHHHDAARGAHGLPDVVGHQDHGLLRGPQYPRDFVRERQPGLEIE